MSTAKREWRVDIRGNLVLSLSVEVNGKVAAANMVMDRLEQRYGPPPAYIERELRSMLMRHLETKLLGPRP
jgi:hypothetical protein